MEKETSMKWHPKDFIAIIVIIAILVYKATGHNGGFDALVALMVGYYFARRNEPDHSPKE